MLQLNSYMNNRFIAWYKRNFTAELRWRSILPLISISFYLSGYFSLFTASWFFSYFILFLTRKITIEKKKLVYTARVKRLIVTHALEWTVLILAGNLLFSHYRFNGMIMALFFALTVILGELKIFYTLLANTLNRPLEKLINYHYIADARRIMSGQQNLIVIGITGSYGKTSSKYILSRILAAKYNVLMTPGSYNTLLGVVRTIREKLKPVHEVFVVEMGAKKSGDIREICELVKPRYALLTSIGYQHLEAFKNIENIIRTKYELVDSVRDSGLAFLNFENEFIRREKSSGKYVSYGLDNNTLAYWAENIEYDNKGLSFDLCTSGQQRIKLKTRLMGRHNVLNIVAACAISLELGIEAGDIISAVKQLPPVPHRLELKDPGAGVLVIDDAFNSNPEGAAEALNVLAQFSGSRRILITPGIIELGEKEYALNCELGKTAALSCDYIILVGRKRTWPIWDGITGQGFPSGRVFVVKNLNEALTKMQEIAVPGSVVLFENDLPDDYEEA